ncbi:MAG: NHL repeat-containing protein [Firmicutes bacterium]|nr:NHL repeat-containing protein [Bacillota bacterium]MCL5038469.1 NHL repeat-containing protein [Bacillota bacterium]
MFILNLRQRKTSVLLLLIVLALFLFYALEIQEEFIINRIVLIKGEWGKGDGQFGLGQGLDGKKYGPQSFCLDQSGNIYVLDTYNNRIALYNYQGEPICSINVGQSSQRKTFLTDVAVDATGNIWVVDNAGGQVLRFTPSGGPLAPFQPDTPEVGDKGDLRVIEGILVDWAGNLYLEDSYTGVEKLTRRVRRFGPKGTLDLDLATVVTSRRDGGSTQALPRDLNSLAVGSAGWLYLDTGREPFQREIMVYREGLPDRQIPITQTDFIKTSALLGTDKSGRVYLGVNLGTSTGRVLVLGSSGKTEREMAAPGSGKIEGRILGRVDRDGNVFLANLAEGHLEIQKVVTQKVKNLFFLHRSGN